VLAAAALLAAPAPALAQSAGDEQYEDPFGGEQQQEQTGGNQEPESTPAPTPAPTAEPAPATPAPSGTEPAPAPAPTTATAVPQAELPRTGFDAALLVAAGAVLLAGGLVLRLRLRERA